MVETRTCDYTGEEIEPGTGTMYEDERTDPPLRRLEGGKKNYFLGREARDLEWTEEGRNQGGE